MNYNMTYQTTDIRADKSRNILWKKKEKKLSSHVTLCVIVYTHTHTLTEEDLSERCLGWQSI